MAAVDCLERINEGLPEGWKASYDQRNKRIYYIKFRMFTVLIVTVVLLWLTYRWCQQSSLRFIPGPSGLPLLGNALQVDSLKMHMQITSWAKKYGSVFKLNLAGTQVIVVSGYKQILEVLVKKGHDFAGRPYSFRNSLVSDGFKDIGLASYSTEVKWRRKISYEFIKQHGQGMDQIERITEKAMFNLLEDLEEKANHPIDIRKSLFECFTEMICIIILGDLPTQEEVTELITVSDSLIQALMPGSGLMLDTIPLLRYLGNSTYKDLKYFDKARDVMVKKWIRQCPTSGFLHVLLNLSNEEKDLHGMDVSMIKQLIFQFVIAGVYTSNSTLTMLMNILVHNNDVQKKLQKEVSEVIGSSRSVTFADKKNLPYHQATILEASRYSSVVPVAIPHETMVATSVADYAIPKGTTVWCNLWGLHHDEDFWKDPYTFQPGRFLDDNGDLIAADHPNRTHLMPFGAGTRVCVGSVLAMSRMFLILASLMQHFTIAPETTLSEQPSCDPRTMTLGLAMVAQPFKVRILPRTTE